MFIRYDKTVSLMNILKSVGSFAVYSGFAAGSFFFSVKTLEFLLVTQNIGLFLFHQFLSVILFVFFLSINVGNIVVSYTTLFKSPEAAFLLSKPVNPVRVFMIKFFDNFFYSSGTLMMVLISFLAGYAWYFKLDLLTAVFIYIFGFFPFMLNAGLTGVLVLLIIINIIVKYGIKRTAAAVGLTYAAALIFFFSAASPVTLVNEVMKYYPDINRYFADLIPAHIRLLPNSWLSDTMFWISSGNFSAALPYFAGQLALTAFLLTVVTFTADKIYLKTWHRTVDYRESKPEEKIRTGSFGFGKGSSIKDPLYESVIKREFFLFMREPVQTVHLAVMVLLMLIYTISLRGLANIAAKQVQLYSLIFLAVYIFNIFIIVTLSLRFIYPLVSLEGKTVWKIRSAPVNTGSILLIKLMFPVLLIMVISLLLSIFSVGRFSIDLILPVLPVTVGTVLLVSALNFAIGGLFVNLGEKNPVRISSSQGASISFLLSAVIIIFLVLLLYGPVHGYFTELRYAYERVSLRLFYQRSFVYFIVSGVISYLLIKAGSRSLERDL